MPIFQFYLEIEFNWKYFEYFEGQCDLNDDDLLNFTQWWLWVFALVIVKFNQFHINHGLFMIKLMCLLFGLMNDLMRTDCLDFLLYLTFCTDLFHHFALLYQYHTMKLAHHKFKPLAQHFNIDLIFSVNSFSECFKIFYFPFPFPFTNECFAFIVIVHVQYGHLWNNFCEFGIWINLHWLSYHVFD